MDLFDQATTLIDGTHKTIGGKAQYVPDYCPYCFKENHKEFHSSFGQIFPDGGYGFKCFVCGEVAGLASLVKFMGGQVDNDDPPIRLKTLQRPAPSQPYWYSQRNSVLDFITTQDDRYDQWYSYKRLTPQMVDDYQLGTGVLVGTRHKDRRLITPMIEDGSPVWFRGRSTEGKGWIGAAGVSPKDIRLPHIDRIPQSPDILILTENYVDGILVNEHTPYWAASVLGVSYWSDSWQQQLIAKQPKLVIVAFDADLAGNLGTNEQAVNVATKRIHGWAKGNNVDADTIAFDYVKPRDSGGWVVSFDVSGVEKNVRIPPPYGIRRVNQLRRHGVDAIPFPWRKNDVGKDIGSLFMQWASKGDE